ncbi:uncharacterized protein [Solanum lycopersicum]|uniref:uncharacterized protein n=1 Tax=Solanum lycopersicum TaxID=4081 RepID=UPI00374978B8
MSVHYHPGNANVVADALSRLSMGSAPHVEEQKKELVKDVHRLAFLGVCRMSISYSGVTIQNGAELSLVVEVKEKKDSDPILLELTGDTKMYRDLREVYWCNGMKRYIADFVSKCPNCQQVKVEHQKPRGSGSEHPYQALIEFCSPVQQIK